MTTNAVTNNIPKLDSNKSEVLMKIKDLELVLGRRPTKHDDSSLYNKARKYFGSWNKMMETAGYKVKYYQYPTVPTELSNDLAYFMGLLITDGHIQFDKRYRVLLYTSYEEERDLIIEIIRNLFNYQPYVNPRLNGFNKRINYEIAVNSKALASYLTNKMGILCGNKSLTVRMPKVILSGKTSVKANFLRGVIDGDGSIIKGAITINSASVCFLEDIISVLHDLGIRTNLKIHTWKSCSNIRVHKKDSQVIGFKCYQNTTYFYPRKKESLLNNIFINNSK